MLEIDEATRIAKLMILELAPYDTISRVVGFDVDAIHRLVAESDLSDENKWWMSVNSERRTLMLEDRWMMAHNALKYGIEYGKSLAVKDTSQ